jgi:hypothetical protein
VILYTDGIGEPTRGDDGEMFGAERVSAIAVKGAPFENDCTNRDVGGRVHDLHPLRFSTNAGMIIDEPVSVLRARRQTSIATAVDQ